MAVIPLVTATTNTDPKVTTAGSVHGTETTTVPTALLVAPLMPTSPAPARLVVTEAAVGKHVGNILAKLDLPPTEDTNRQVLAVLTYLRATAF